MRNSKLLLVTLLAACGSDSAGTNPGEPVVDAPVAPPVIVDAPGSDPMVDAPAVTYDLSCLGNAAPTTAEATISLSGTTETVNVQGMSLAPVPSVTVGTCAATGMSACANVTSDATTGAFTTASVVTSGVPVDLYLEAAKTGYRTTYLFPPGPLTTVFPNVPVLMLTPATFTLLSGLAAVHTTAGTGTLVIEPVDCTNKPIMGATATATQNGTAITTQYVTKAGAIVFDVPPGDVEVGATYMGVTLRTHTVQSFADADIVTVVRPGF